MRAGCHQILRAGGAWAQREMELANYIEDVVAAVLAPASVDPFLRALTVVA